jgi:hypothetical protein
MAAEPAAAARAERDRWQLWLKVVDQRLLPPLAELEQLIAVRRQCADRLWQAALAPVLAGEFAAVVAEPAGPELRRIRDEIRRVASAAHGLADSLYRLHGTDPSIAEATGTAAMWMTLAAAAVDHLVDERGLSPDAVRAQLNPTAFIAALAPGAAIPATRQPFLDLLLERAVLAIRARLATAATRFDAEIVDEMLVCLREMINGQLASSELRITPHAELAEVEITLHRVNALTVWIATYLGLLGAPAAPPRERVRALRDVTTRVGEIGWALDALSDIHVDLDAGVWSLVWLELARATGIDAPWIARVRDEPALALDALDGSDVCDRLLARIGVAIDAIERAPHVDPAAAAALARFCRYMVWAFLVPPASP